MGAQQPQNSQGKQKKDQQGKREQDARDGRQKREELDENGNPKGQKDPKNGERSDETPTPGKADPDKTDAKGDGSKPTQDPWITALPPEIRDYYAAGNLEKIPAKYRKLIEAYSKYLNKQRAKDAR